MTTFVSPSSVGDLSDEEWLDKLDASLERDVIDGTRYPRFPDDQTQMNFVGSSRRHALLEAVRFLRYTTDALAWAGGPAPSDCSVVDFGCGWGRITRTLLRSFDPAKVVGVDPLESMVEACREWFAPSVVAFETIGNEPPLSMAEGSVDLITAYSVFSHLPEQLATAWMTDFARVLRPGGIVVATTQARSFIDLCDQMRTDPEYKDSEFLHYQLMARSFVDQDDAHRRYDRGEFLYAANGGGALLGDAVYGDSLFSRLYAERAWGDVLDVVWFDDKPHGMPQSVFVLQKPSAAADARRRGPSFYDALRRVEELERETARLNEALEREQARSNEALAEMRRTETWRLGQALLSPVRLGRRVSTALRSRRSAER